MGCAIHAKQSYNATAHLYHPGEGLKILTISLLDREPCLSTLPVNESGVVYLGNSSNEYSLRKVLGNAGLSAA